MKVELKKLTLLNGETMGYRERSGGEEVLLLIHGNQSSSLQWDVLLEKLDQSYKVYAVDLRGFGTSTYHTSIQSLKDFSEDLKLFADELGLDRFHLMGWSNGGGVAMQLAADYPDYVQKLILLASLSTRGYPMYKSSEAGVPITDVRLKTKEEIMNDQGLQSTLEAMKNRDKPFMKKAWDYLVFSDNKPEEEQYERYLEDVFKQRNVVDVMDAANRFNISDEFNGLVDGTGEISQIAAPVLVVWGTRDCLTPRYMTQEIVDDFRIYEKDVDAIYLDAGHSPLIDNPEELIKAMLDFLQKK